MTKRIFDQISLIRESGETNMFDIKNVMHLAIEECCYELTTWLSDANNWKEYSRLLMTGKPELDEEPEIISVYWNDLRVEKQKEIFNALGSNGNYDLIPIAEIAIYPVKNEE